MAIFERGDIRICYEDTGSGPPLLLIAPGGMRSTMDRWAMAPFDPREAFVAEHRVIAMDQRNAGGSTAPVHPGDGWHTYTQDQIALLDHLGIERCQVMGMCIGGPYCMGLMKAIPERIGAAVLLQPIGLDGNRDAFHAMFDDWKEEIAGAHPEIDEAGWARFRSNMYDGDFLFNLSPDDVAAVSVPMLVAMGDDLYHPQSISRDIARLAPDATLIERWKEGDAIASGLAAIRTFLEAHR